MSAKINFTGETFSQEVHEVTKGGFSEVTVSLNGDTITFKGSIKEIIRKGLKELGVSQAAAYKMETPSGETRFISSDRDPSLNEPVEDGSKFTPVYQGKAATEGEEVEAPSEAPSTEEAPTDASESVPSVVPSEALVEAPQTVDF